MKRLLLATLFCFFSFSVAAQLFSTQRPVVCGEADQILNALIAELGEQPIWQGSDPNNSSRYMLFVNPNRDEWTLIQFNRQVACIIATGHGSTLLADRLGSPI